jgi:hypothetical protein
VKIDVVSSRLSKRKQIWIDVIGFVFFLTPVCLVILYYGIPFFLQGFRSGEMSSNAGGLIRWPVYLMMPDRLLAAAAAGPVGAGQAHRLPAGPDPRPDAEARGQDGRRGTGRGDPPPGRSAGAV